MKFILTVVALSLLGSITAQSCCTASGGANLSIGNIGSTASLKKGELSFQLKQQFSDFSALSNVNPMNVSIANVDYMNSFSGFVTYGLSDKLSLSGMVPFQSIQMNLEGFNDHGKRTSAAQQLSGFGDAIILGNYQLINEDDFPFSILIKGGIELPTGLDVNNSGNLNNSIGSNSWDPLIGLGLRRTLKSQVLYLDVLHKQTKENSSGLNQGAFSLLQLGSKIQLTKRSESKLVFLNLGLNAQRLKHQIENQTVIPNTGSSNILSRIGFTIELNKKWRGDVTFESPIYQSFRGQQNKLKFRATSSITYLLNSKK